jgi:hypothetical protein
LHYGWSNPVIPKPAIVTGLLLAVAVLALAGLGSLTVPVSTTQTITAKTIQVSIMPRGAEFTVSLTYTTTRLRTESSTSLVPESEALGLTERSFTILAVVVIGILALLMAYVTLKPRVTHRHQNYLRSQFRRYVWLRREQRRFSGISNSY